MWRWYLVYTKPSAEDVAQAHLQRQGYETYLPRALESIRRDGHWRRQITPLFPRYLFLRLDAGSQVLSPARSTAGVHSLVRFGFDYACVPDRVINGLRSRADPETGLHHLRESLAFTAGARVKVQTGTFDGLEGIFECRKGIDRAIVLLNMLGRDVRVCVDADALFSHA